MALALLVPSLVLLAPGQESQREPEMQSGTPDSVRRANTASVLFDRNLNTFNWIGRLSLDTTFVRTRFTASAQLLANIVQPEEGSGAASHSSESIQKNLALGVRYPLTDFAGLDARWSSLVFSDNRNIGLSNAASHTLITGLAFFPLDRLSVTPLGGYRWDTQGGLQDRGGVVGLETELFPIDFDGYHLSGTGKLRRDVVSPRILEDHAAQLGIYKPFGPFSLDSLDIGFVQTRREYYSRGDSAIESRTDRSFSLANLLAFEVARNLTASVFVNIGSRLLDKNERPLLDAAYSPTTFDTQIEEFRLDTYVQAAFQSADNETSAMVRLGYSERSESHRAMAPDQMPPNISVLFGERNKQEQTKDNLARRVALTGGGAIPLFSSTRLFLTGSAGILRYDTPSELNFEDRDELLIAVTLGVRHAFSKSLEAVLTLDGTMSHLVYLLKERSANNNFNRILRLAPRTNWRPAPWFSTTNACEVLANYTVYDFEQQVALVRSFSYRQFSWIDSTQVELTPRVGLDFFTYLKLYERGLLKWDEFRERTENSYVDRTLALQLRFSPYQSTVVAVGVQYFSQARYLFKEAVKSPDSFTSSVGPTCAIRWMIGPHSRLQFHGWYERRRLPDGTFRSLASMTMHIYLHL
jgi:hypothetical protein